MSQEQGTESQGQPQPEGQGQVQENVQEQPTEKPYAKYLEQFPEGLRPTIDPIFSQWDQDVNKKFEGIHDQYKPWKPVMDLGYDPDLVRGAVQLAETLQTDPERVFNLLAEQLGKQIVDAQAAADEDDDPTVPEWKKEFTQTQEMVQKMARIVLADKQRQQVEEQDREVDKALSALHEKHGEFDDEWVITKAIANGGDLEAAYKEWDTFKNTLMSQLNTPNAPTVLSSSGGVPAGPGPNLRDEKERKNLVAQMLARAAQENR